MKHEERKRQEQHEQQQNGRKKKKKHTLTNVLPGFAWTTSGAPRI